MPVTADLRTLSRYEALVALGASSGHEGASARAMAANMAREYPELPAMLARVQYVMRGASAEEDGDEDGGEDEERVSGDPAASPWFERLARAFGEGAALTADARPLRAGEIDARLVPAPQGDVVVQLRIRARDVVAGRVDLAHALRRALSLFRSGAGG